MRHSSQVWVRCGLLLCALSERSTARLGFIFINGTRKQSTCGPMVRPPTSPPLIPVLKLQKKHIGAWIQVFISKTVSMQFLNQCNSWGKSFNVSHLTVFFECVSVLLRMYYRVTYVLVCTPWMQQKKRQLTVFCFHYLTALWFFGRLFDVLSKVQHVVACFPTCPSGRAATLFWSLLQSQGSEWFIP